MSTRSLIGLMSPSGKVRYIYCHFDGYIEGVGKTLLQHWSNPNKVEALIALGDISVLGEEIGEKHDFDWMLDASLTPAEIAVDPRSKGVLSYGRDRGGEIEVNETEPEDFWAGGNYGGIEFAYLLQPDGRWEVYADEELTPGGPRSLAEVAR